MAELCLGILERAARHLQQRGVRASQGVPVQPGRSDLLTGRLQVTMEQIGVAHGIAVGRLKKKIVRFASNTLHAILNQAIHQSKGKRQTPFAALRLGRTDAAPIAGLFHPQLSGAEV